MGQPTERKLGDLTRSESKRESEPRGIFCILCKVIYGEAPSLLLLALLFIPFKIKTRLVATGKARVVQREKKHSCNTRRMIIFMLETR